MQQIELIRCEVYAMSLTRKACAGFYTAAEAKAPQPWEPRFHCRGCPIGAVNAGRDAPDGKAKAAFRTVQDEWAHCCTRCLRLSSRLIGGKHCPSCYNRTREVRIGANRKGNVPTLRLRSEAVVVATETGARLAQVDDVLDRMEAIVTLARKAAGPVAFGRRPQSVPPGATVGHWRGWPMVATRQLELRI